MVAVSEVTQVSPSNKENVMEWLSYVLGALFTFAILGWMLFKAAQVAGSVSRFLPK